MNRIVSPVGQDDSAASVRGGGDPGAARQPASTLADVPPADLDEGSAVGGSLEQSAWDGDALSESGSLLAPLSDQQKKRLTALLDRYLRGLEQGSPESAEALLGGNEDLAEVLRVYLEKLDALHGVAAGFQRTLVDGAGPAETPRKLGEYTIIREIGRGGMGIVYEARQESLDRRVALKLLPMAAMLDARQIARFKNESHAAGQLEHPNIVPVHHVGEERGVHYYAMQFIDGESVACRIAAAKRRGDFQRDDWRTLTQWMIAACEALDHAHGCGIVHRDIKPSNLLLDSQDRIWVTDFGLARSQNNLSLTRSGDLIGTIRYMSPEQACGRPELVDHRTDIYSLAVTLYEWLTLTPAIAGEDSPTVLRAIDRAEPVRVSRLLPAAPPDLEIVLRKAMAKERDERYATAKEFANDLRAVIEGRPTVAKPPGALKVTARWLSRRRKLVAALTVALALAATWLLISSLLIVQNSRVGDRRTPQGGTELSASAGYRGSPRRRCRRETCADPGRREGSRVPPPGLARLLPEVCCRFGR